MARKERKGDEKRGDDMEYKDRDLERFLLAGTGKRDVNQEKQQKGFVGSKDLESGLEIPRPKLSKPKRSSSSSSTDYDEHPETQQKRGQMDRRITGEVVEELILKENGPLLPYLKVDAPSMKEFDALDRRDVYGSSMKHHMKAWNWVWGGSKYSGATCMAISSLSYALMGLFVKLLSVRSIPSSQIVMFRCGLITLLAGASLRQMRHPLLGTPRVRKLVFARAVIGFVSLSAFFYSIQILPLRDATVLNFTTPVFTVILATLYLNEHWGATEAAGTFCSFLGVLLVTQPQFLSGKHVIAADSIWDMYMGVAIALIAAATGALSYILVRIIGQHGEPPLVCVFAFAAFSTPMAALGTMVQGYKAPTSMEVSLLMMVGLMAYFAQVFLTRALQLEKASSVTPIQYLKVLFTFILGVMFLQEIPTLWDVIGALLIAGSAASISYKSEPKP